MIEGLDFVLEHGDCLEVLRRYDDCAFASIVCDPPHGIDTIPSVEVWAEVLRVAAPGAFLLAFGHPRTWHNLACAIEGAGWVYADTLGYVFRGQGASSRTRLKPAWRPIILACKGLNALQSVEGRTNVFHDGSLQGAGFGSGRVGLELYRDLVRLATPVEGCVLDPFMGSGLTGLAALEEGFTFVGIERDAATFELAEQRFLQGAARS